MYIILCRLSKKGYNVNYTSQAYKVETTENSIKVLATPYTVMNSMRIQVPVIERTEDKVYTYFRRYKS